MQETKRTKVVTVGGGSGQFALLKALKGIENIDITAIVAMSDSGGSTGVLRDEFGELPTGDVLKCLIALSPLKDARTLFQTRFSAEKLKNHNAGNMLMIFLSQYLGRDFAQAINAMSEILKIKGKVLPVTTDKTTLVAKLENGKLLFGETVIDVVQGTREEKIVETMLVPHAGRLEVYPPVLDALKEADYILIGPGDFYTSIIPNLLVPKVVETIKDSKAKLVYILNLMTKYGETNGFTAYDFVTKLESYIKCEVHTVLANSTKLDYDISTKYEKEKAKQVVVSNKEEWGSRSLKFFDLLYEGTIVRHDSRKLKAAIEELMNEEK